MRSFLRSRTGVCCLLLSLLWSETVLAQGGMPPFGVSPMGFQSRNMLNLSADQQGKIDAIAKEAQKEVLKLAKQTSSFGPKLRELLLKDAPDPKAVGRLYGSIFANQRKMIELGIKTHNRQLKVLKKEQRSQWLQMRRGMIERSFPTR